MERAGSGTAASPYTLGIANNGVTNARIADNAVNSAKIANGTIITEDLANGSVTFAKTNFISRTVSFTTPGGGLTGSVAWPEGCNRYNSIVQARDNGYLVLRPIASAVMIYDVSSSSGLSATIQFYCFP